jgi:hypothetical protein
MVSDLTISHNYCYHNDRGVFKSDGTYLGRTVFVREGGPGFHQAKPPEGMAVKVASGESAELGVRARHSMSHGSRSGFMAGLE